MAEKKRQAPWIKMRGSLLTNPKVIRMARWLASDNLFCDWMTPGEDCGTVSAPALRCVTVALLLRVWSRAREHGKFVGRDLILEPFEADDLDEFAEAPMVGQAMVQVGWAIEDSRNVRITFPDFKAYNVPMSNAERQSAWRERASERNENSNEINNAEVTNSNAPTVTKRVTKTETETETINTPPKPPKGGKVSRRQQKKNKEIEQDELRRWYDNLHPKERMRLTEAVTGSEYGCYDVGGVPLHHKMKQVRALWDKKAK